MNQTRLASEKRNNAAITMSPPKSIMYLARGTSGTKAFILNMYCAKTKQIPVTNTEATLSFSIFFDCILDKKLLMFYFFKVILNMVNFFGSDDFNTNLPL